MSQAPNASPSTSKALSPVENVRSLLSKSKEQIRMALPKHMSPERMMRIAMTSVQRTPKLLECDPITLLGAIIQSAQLGLEPDGVTGQAYLVPFRNNKKNRMEVQFIPGYKGLMSLARRSGEIGSIEARVVYEKDYFEFEFGLNPVLKHVPARLPEEERGQITFFYAVARIKNFALPQFEVMSKEEVDDVRKRSKAADSGPWVTDYIPMGQKTVIRRLCKFLPQNAELATAIALDEKAEVDLPQDLGVIVDANEIGTDDAPAAKPLPSMPQAKSSAAPPPKSAPPPSAANTDNDAIE